MMRHPSFERLRSYAAGELRPAERGPLAAHLEHCAACRQAVQATREVTAAARAAFGPAAPRDGFARVIERRSAGERVILPTADAGASPHRRTVSQLGTRPTRLRPAGAWAALLLVAASGVAAALPGSAVRAWFARHRAAPLTPPAVASATHVLGAPRLAEGGSTPIAGVSVPAASGELWVAIEAPHPALRVRVRLVAQPGLEVRGIGPSAWAVFRPGVGGVSVADAGRGELQVDVPASAPRFVLRMGGVPYLVKTAAQVRVLAPDADTIGTELLLGSRP